MSAPGPVLKEIHRLRRYLVDLESKIAQAPKQLQLQKTKLQLAEDNLVKAQDELKHLKVKIHDREVTIKTSFQQIAKWEKQRETVENKKEYDALNSEIADAQKRIQSLEEEVFETMTLVEEKSAQLPQVQKATQQVRDDVAKYEKEYDDRLNRFREEMTRSAEELKATEVNVPEDLRPAFDKLIQTRGVEALGSVENKICMACYTELTPQLANNVNRGMFVICKSCGRMLYA